MSLEEDIIDNPINKSNLKELLTSFDRDLFVPFVGAGPSTVLGAANWKELFSKLCSVLGAKRVIRKRFPNGTIDYPTSFSRLYHRVKDKSKFYSELFKIIEPTNSTASFFHVRLVQAFSSYITTNYDSPIEEAFNNEYRDRKLKNHYFSCYGLKKLDDGAVYLHGHKDINFCIIKSEDYDYFYPSIGINSGGIPILEEFLTEVFTKKSIIFVGVSFDDKYVDNYFRYIAARETLRYPHYWLLSESAESYRAIEQKSNELRKRKDFGEAEDVLSKFYTGELNIKPIVYKDVNNESYHVFSQRLFERLIELKPINTASKEIGGTPVR